MVYIHFSYNGFYAQVPVNPLSWGASAKCSAPLYLYQFSHTQPWLYTDPCILSSSIAKTNTLNVGNAAKPFARKSTINNPDCTAYI